MRALRIRAAIGAWALMAAACCLPADAERLLIPMDLTQTDHLRAYGVAFWALERELPVEWLLNYRGGSFLIDRHPLIVREAQIRGVSTEVLSESSAALIYAEVDAANMEVVRLEKAPRIAVYTPPNTQPWDDAVTMALEYAEIPYDNIWDDDVIRGRLGEYEWLHLHHEDFTGQYSKFFITYAGAAWLQEEVARNEEMAERMGFASVPDLKKGVARQLRQYVEDGGFLLAMCSATETLELALGAEHADIAAVYADGSPPDPNATSRMEWDLAMAFVDGVVQTASSVNAFSDIDAHQVNTPWRLELGVFTLFDFSAKFDPVPAMLTQNHVSVIPDFYGLTTSFRTDRLKPGAIVLARDGDMVKYVHGNFGEGTWTYFGGHDPEDPEHQIGDPPTNLDLHRSSPGYRLILNNVLFPAARKQQLKT